MNTRRFPRSAAEAFRAWPENCYGIERMPVVKPRSASESAAGVALAVVMGIAAAGLLVHWLSCIGVC